MYKCPLKVIYSIFLFKILNAYVLEQNCKNNATTFDIIIRQIPTVETRTDISRHIMSCTIYTCILLAPTP